MDQRSLYLIRQALNAVFKRRRLVVLLFLLVFVPANVGSMIREPVYRATAKLLMTRERTYPEVSPLERQESVDHLPNEALVNSEMQLMRSRDLLTRLHFELLAEATQNGEEESKVPGVQSLEQKLIVVRKPNSNVVEVFYRCGSEEQAIRVVNTFVRLYVDYNIEEHQSPGALNFFAGQARAAKDAYIQADMDLERFDATHGLTSIATEKEAMLRQRSQIEADLRRTEAEITELTTKAAALEAELEYIPEHEATEVDMVPNPLVGYLRENLARLEMERDRLLQLYTPQHRLVMDVESEIAAIKQQVTTQEMTVIGRKKMATTHVRRSVEEDLLQVQAELGALEARRALLTEKIADYEARIRVMHTKHYQVMRMRRDRQEKKDVYTALVEKLNQLKVSAAMDTAGISNVTIVEAASGPLKKEPNFKGMTFVLSFFAALLISLGSAVVTEMLNPVMNSELDVRHHLGLPVLAEVGVLAANGNGNGNGNGNERGVIERLWGRAMGRRR